MTAKRNDRKERWLQENNDCNKAMTAKNRPLQRAVLEVWSLPRKLRFHIFNLQILKEVSHESFHCTSSTCRFCRKSRTKASFAQLQLADFEGNSHESFPLHIFNLQILKEISHENFVFISLQLDQEDKMCRAKDLSLASQQWHKSLCFQLTKFQILIPFLLPILLPIPITWFRLPVFLQPKWVCSVHAFKNIGKKDNLFFSCKRLSTVYLRKHR